MPRTHSLKKSLKIVCFQITCIHHWPQTQHMMKWPYKNKSLHFSPVEHSSGQQSQDKYCTAFAWKRTWLENPHCCSIPENDSSSPRGFALPPHISQGSWLYNSVVQAVTPGRFLGSLESEEAAANPPNDDFPPAAFLPAGHRPTARHDPLLPLLCLRVHFHHVSDLLHDHLFLWHHGEEC